MCCRSAADELPERLDNSIIILNTSLSSVFLFTLLLVYCLPALVRRIYPRLQKSRWYECKRPHRRTLLHTARVEATHEDGKQVLFGRCGQQPPGGDRTGARVFRDCNWVYLQEPYADRAWACDESTTTGNSCFHQPAAARQSGTASSGQCSTAHGGQFGTGYAGRARCSKQNPSTFVFFFLSFSSLPSPPFLFSAQLWHHCATEQTHARAITCAPNPIVARVV